MAACVYQRMTSLGFRAASVAFRGVTPVKCHVRCFSASLKLFSERRYTGKHEWVSVQNNVGTVGISNYAQDQLGEVVYVQLPEVGDEFSKDDESGSLESVKAASEIYSPVSGKVTAINPLVQDEPNFINKSPYEKGWLYQLELTVPEELNDLMDEGAYAKFTSSTD